MRKLRDFCLKRHIAVLWDVPMSDYTSFRIGGRADALLFPDTETELVSLLLFLRAETIPFRVIGNATNLLVSDDGYRGALIMTKHIRSVSVSGRTARASCGTPINVLCRTLADFSLGGIEELYGIPGTLGGAVFMNAGAFGRTIADRLSFVSALHIPDGKTMVFSKEECFFSYRSSFFAKNRDYVIMSADFSLTPGRCGAIRDTMKTVLEERMQKQPTALPNAGSVFLKPDGHYAARLIEDAGLVGARIGGAAVSVKHAGFIVNLGGATAKDVLDLINHIKETVQNIFGIELETEIEYIDQ